MPKLPLRRTSPARHRTAKPTRRRALELLADCGHEGCTEAVLLANGFTIETMVELVRAGLATATPQRIRAGREMRRCAGHLDARMPACPEGCASRRW
jgi:hypothetical protein